MTTQSKAPVEDRIAEIRERADLESRPGRLPRSSIADLREDRAYLLTELTASQSRERALTEERDGLRKQVYDLTGIVSDKNDKIAGLTSENKRLKDALGKIRAAAAPMGYDAGDSHIHEIALAALQQSQGGGE